MAVNRRTVRRAGVAVVALALATSDGEAGAQARDATRGVDCPSSVGRKVIAGVILDSASRDPVPYANLSLSFRDRESEGFPRYALSDSLGGFCFSELAAGPYTLRVLKLDPTRYPLGGSDLVIEVQLSQDDTAQHLSVRYGPFVLRPAEAARRHGLLTELQAQRQKWSVARPPRYRLSVVLQCYCIPGPVTPTFDVAGDSVVAIHGASAAHMHEFRAWYRHQTVEHLFDELEGELRSEGRRVTEIEYDPRYGFPIRYRSVASHDPHGAADHSWFVVRATLSEARRR